MATVHIMDGVMSQVELVLVFMETMVVQVVAFSNGG